MIGMFSVSIGFFAEVASGSCTLIRDSLENVVVTIKKINSRNTASNSYARLTSTASEGVEFSNGSKEKLAVSGGEAHNPWCR